MKIILVILILPFYSFAQTDEDTNSGFVIEETYNLISKLELNDFWKSLNIDTTSLTLVKADFNGDGKIDQGGLYTGVSSGLFIMDNVTDSINLEIVHILRYDSSWYDNNGFNAVLSKGDRDIELNIEGEIDSFKATNHFLKIHFSNGTEQALIYVAGEFKRMKLSTTKPKQH